MLPTTRPPCPQPREHPPRVRRPAGPAAGRGGQLGVCKLRRVSADAAPVRCGPGEPLNPHAGPMPARGLAAGLSDPAPAWLPQNSRLTAARPAAPRHPADALGGNALALVVGTLRQGDWEASSTTLRHLAAAQGVRNYPVINHGRTRGLFHKLRFRLLSVMVRRAPRGRCRSPCLRSSRLCLFVARVWTVLVMAAGADLDHVGPTGRPRPPLRKTARRCATSWAPRPPRATPRTTPSARRGCATWRRACWRSARRRPRWRRRRPRCRRARGRGKVAGGGGERCTGSAAALPAAAGWCEGLLPRVDGVGSPHSSVGAC
jgi:hypothetical protein